MSLFVLIAGAAMLQGGQTAKKPDEPKVDRSGEPVLTQIFEKSGKLRRLSATIIKSGRDEASQPLAPENTITLWYDSPQRYRLVSVGWWGDQSLIIRNGASVVNDPLDDAQPATRAKAADVSLAKSMNPNTDNDFGFGAPTLIFYYLLSGPAAIKDLVDEKGPITAKPGSVTFHSKKQGTVTLLFYPKDKQMLVRRIEFDDLDTRMNNFKRFPDFFDEPVSPLEVEDIRYDFSARFPKWAFNTDGTKTHPVVGS